MLNLPWHCNRRIRRMACFATGTRHLISPVSFNILKGALPIHSRLSDSDNQEFGTVRPLRGDQNSTVVKVLCYKSEGRWFNPSWCPWNFSLT